jgi:hypothetical protein
MQSQKINVFQKTTRRGPLQVERVNTKDLVVNSMPDGSRVIRNSKNETVFALNATAGAAWDACSSATTIAGVAAEMRRSFDPNVTDELAETCIFQFQEKNLVSISDSAPKHTRRAVLAGLSAVALPLVVSLTVGEQKAHAQAAGSTDPSWNRSPRASVPKERKKFDF